MTNIHITESDVGRKFRLRNGDELTVNKIFADGSYRVKGNLEGYYWFTDGTYYADIEEAEDLDIVERLPEEGDVCIKCGVHIDAPFSTCVGPCTLKDPQAPTMTASNGEFYPVQYWTTQQRFSDRTPPEGVDIIIQGEDLGHLEWMKGVAGKYDIELDRQDLIAKSATWTLAPTPAVEKVESQIWDEYMIEDEFFFGDYGLLPSDLNIKKELRRIDALHAWKDHILSQNKGES